MRLVMIAIPLLFLVSCATPQVKKQLFQKGYTRGYAEADTDCTSLQKKISGYVESLKKENEEKTARLKLFNQVDNAGNLRNSDIGPTLKEDLQDEINQAKPWMK